MADIEKYILLLVTLMIGYFVALYYAAATHNNILGWILAAPVLIWGLAVIFVALRDLIKSKGKA